MRLPRLSQPRGHVRLRPRRAGGGVALAASALAVALVAAGCGGSDSGSDGGAAPATGTADALGAPKAATGSPVKVGWVSTGQTPAVNTSNEIKAAQAVVDYANAYLGGLRGHKIVLDACEDKSVPATAQACGNQFVAGGDVAVAGGSPGQTDPWIQIVRPAGIPVGLNYASTQVVLGTPGVYVFGNPLAAYGTPAAYARANKITSAAILVIDVPAASGPSKAIAPSFFKNAGATANVVAVAPGTADMTPQVASAQAKKPGMYYVVGDPTFCSSAIKAIKTLGITVPIVALDRCIGSDKGASIPGGFSGVTIVAESNTDPATPEGKLFEQVISRWGNGIPADGNAIAGYQGMLGLVRAVNAAPGTDVTSASIEKALATMPATPYPLGGGATFKCDGTAVAAVSKNVCSSAGFIANAAADGSLSEFHTLDATGIYKLG